MNGARRLLILFLSVIVINQVAIAQKARYHGEIVYRLSKHITWPEKSHGYKFVIGVIGNENDFSSFQRQALDKGKFNGTPIEVRYYLCAEEIDDCHMIYVSENCKVDIRKIIKKTKRDPVLIVSGNEGYGEYGSIINFVGNEGKISFEFNKEQANKRELLVSDTLLELATVI